MTDCNDQKWLFQELGYRKVEVDFGGGYLSSDGGDVGFEVGLSQQEINFDCYLADNLCANYWQASHVPPLRIASREQTIFPASVISSLLKIWSLISAPGDRAKERPLNRHLRCRVLPVVNQPAANRKSGLSAISLSTVQ
jgi:hypothetical protein